MLNLEYINSCFTKKYSLTSLYLVIMSNLTHLTRQKYKGKIISRIFEKFHVGSETGSGSETN
jgi:hypothetical protein